MSDGSIAIVGASCRFPGAEDLEGFWQLLASGVDAVSEVGPDRWSTRFFHHSERGEPGKSYTWAAGLIDGIDLFEPSFFGISPREATQMDPQQRLMLELVWHAVEDSGIPAGQLSGSNAGVYIGASTTDYSDLQLGDPAVADSYFMTGNTLSILANRISYVFDFRGPSLTIDTACSSSLVAVHHACEAIRSGRVPMAIAGGINLLLAPYPYIGFCRAAMLSRRGRCFAFDERADGYVRGEGGGVVILKPLEDAVAAGNAIRGVILGSGVNSDGRTIGLSLPSEAAQASLLRSVHAAAGVTPKQLAFLEMHGTGTPAGDPIEAAAVGRTLGQSRSDALPIGSVKTNIGHLEPASGMAGLLKAALALDRGVVPPTLHCESPNPDIPFDTLNLRLVRTAEPIVSAPGQRYAGVNSFGFGGTNAHVVLAASPPRQEGSGASAPMPPLVVSARTEASLRELINAWCGALAAAPAERAPLLARSAGRGRDHHAHRLVALGRDPAATAQLLSDWLDGSSAADVITGSAVTEPKLAFVFSGNGAQFPAMGRNALRSNWVFRAAIEEVDGLLRPELDWSVIELLETGISGEALARADVAQPLLFAIQVGVVQALKAIGIRASGYLGHSVGEIAAAWGAGALSLTDAARVVLMRSRQQQRTQGTGRMAAVALGRDATCDLLAELESPLEIAAFNAARSVTISGPNEEIERLAAAARRRGLGYRRLDLDFAFHSRQMDPIREDLLASLAGLVSRPPKACLASTVTGEMVETQALDAEYWWHNVRTPVRFAEATARLIGEGYRIFLEIGPRAVLKSYLTDALRSAGVEGRVIGTLSRKESDEDPFPAIGAQCHVSGYDWTAEGPFDGPVEPRDLPLYRWQRERFWFGRTAEVIDLVGPPFDHPLLGFRRGGAAPCWVNHLDRDALPWIGDHTIEGVAVLPAAAMLEMAVAAAHWRWPDASVLEIADLEIQHPLPFEKAGLRELRTTLGADEWELASRPRLSNEPLTVHATGRVTSRSDLRGTIFWADDPPAPRRQIEGSRLYRFARLAGMEYGARFKTVDRVEITDAHEGVAHLDASPIGDAREGYLLHPALLDGALQGLFGLFVDHRHQRTDVAFLPWRFGRFRLLAPFARVPRRAKLRLTRIGVRSVCADIVMTDEAGGIVAELADCWFRRVDLKRRRAVDEHTLRVDLVPAPLAEAGIGDAVDFDAILSHLSVHRRNQRARQEQTLLLDALIGSVALQSLDRFIERGCPFHVGELVEAGQIAPDSTGIAECLLCLLERFGAATRLGSEWRIEPANDLPETSEVWRLLLAEAPDLVAELALAAAAVEKLPRILADGPKQSDTLPSAMVEHLVQASPASASDIELLCDALAEVATAWPKCRPLRILELGPSVGGVTGRIFNRLAQSGATLAYTAACTDGEQVARYRSVADPQLGFSCCQWSPRDGIEALNAANKFDIILAVNSCSRLSLDTPSLVTLRDLLVTGGLFLAVEPETNPLWDVVFGQNAGWWQGGSRPRDASPLRSAADWHAELAAAGFLPGSAVKTGAGPWPSAIFWGAAPSRSEQVLCGRAETTSITIVGENSSFRSAVQKRLTDEGHQTELAQFPGIVASNDERRQRTVVFLAEAPGDADPALDVSKQIVTLARLATIAVERSAVLWVVTCDAHQITLPTRGEHLVGSALWGFTRALINEMPGLTIHMLDLPSVAAPRERAQMLAAELAAASHETEVVWTQEGRHVLRLRPGLPPRWAKSFEVLGVATMQNAGRDSPGWAIKTPRPAGPGEVEIEVHAAGLNFRDMMWATGLLPEEALIDGFAGPTYGLECAGVIRAIGPGVANVAIGDRVMGFAPASLSTRVVTIADAVVPIPPETGFAEAATIPVTFVTVAYALGHLAKLAPGEHVLIHAAAGGVGLAAIQYAKQRGAIVTATAGSEVKRAFLLLAGADYVLDSRDLTFSDAVRKFTGGRGVDVVLNSLSGEGMERSLEALKPFGRFLELGKADLYLNRRVRLRPFRHNISYFAIDIDQLPVSRPDLARGLLAEISAALFKGEIRPLAHRVFSFAELDDALRLMQSSGHIGKLVLQPRGNTSVRLRQAPELALRRDGTYLVTGGIEGFGYECARWLVAHGAGSIALVGRRGPVTPGSEARVAELEAEGAEVRVYRGDVADRGSLAGILDAIRASQPPLRGIVHAASVISDALVSEIDLAGVAAIMQPKLAGALALDALTREDPIELFLLFSSATTLVGAPGQGAYLAANMALEALARRRRAEGKPALAVAWGPIEDAGYLAERPEALASLARRLGARPIPAAQALSGLSALVASGLPTVAFVDANWSEARRFLPSLATPLFSEIRAKSSPSASDEPLADRLGSLDPEAALALLKTIVAEEAAMILRLPAEGIDPTRPLSEIGMDSLMAVELRLALENRLRIELPLVSLTEGTSVASIAMRLAGTVATAPRDGRVVALAARHEFVEEGMADRERAAAE
jgi:phthiocerol/phenolphthiocerol synthesis type-I polyketide synthase C